MRKIESISVSYEGYNTPETITEIEFEVLGLEKMIAGAAHRVATLKHLLKLKQIVSEAIVEGTNETISEISVPEIDKQKG